jgi:hypothetical protein
MQIAQIKKEFNDLAARLETFGKTKCKFYAQPLNKKTFFRSNNKGYCKHPDMDYGGITRNTDCELINCPRIIYGNARY